jgi:hypothetical protein
MITKIGFGYQSKVLNMITKIGFGYQSKVLNMITKIGFGYLCLREENLSFNNDEIFKLLIQGCSP